jgi:hypothetical protein
MSADEPPRLILPGEFTDPNGLVRLTPGIESLRGNERAAIEAVGASYGHQVVLMTQPPSFFDDVYVYATHREVHEFVFKPGMSELFGVDERTTADVIELVRTLPFEPAMRYAASIQRSLRFGYVNAEWQRRLVFDVYGTSAVGVACMLYLRSRDRVAIFTEQQLFALQRLLVLHASDELADDLSPEQYDNIRLALFYIPGTVLQDEVGDPEPEYVSDPYWLRRFVSLGSFAAANNVKHDLARTHRLYSVIAESRVARNHIDYCPIDEWLRDSYELSFLELQALGTALLFGSKIIVNGEMPVTVRRDYFAAASCRDRLDGGLRALVADRDWYRTQFSKSPEDPRRAAFEIQPFLRRPGLRQTDGSVVTVAPRAMSSWLSATGTYYRLFDLVRADEQARLRFTRFNGFLEESYARLLVHAAHPNQRSRRLVGAAGRVYGEVTYLKRKNEFKTPDVIIDAGTDLVLIEVTAKRLTEKSVVEADADSVVRDVQMMIIKKMKQLGDRLRDMFEDPSRVPMLDLKNVRRVWPIIVSSEGIFHSPSVWGYTSDVGGAALTFTREEVSASVQPHILLDLEELEILMGLVSEGHDLVGLLERKVSDTWRQLHFKSLVSRELASKWSGSPKFIDGEVRRALKPAVRMHRVEASSVSSEPRAA